MIRILLLCNSQWAIPAIEELIGNHNLVGIGIPRREKSTRHQLQFMLPESQPLVFTLSKADWVETLKQKIIDLKADVVFVVTFPFKIPPELLSLPRYGIINFHFGALPKYPGDNPVFWQIRNREPFGAVSVHRMDEGLDTGPLLKIGPVRIFPQDSFGMVCIKISYIVVELVKEVIARLEVEGDNLTYRTQDKITTQYSADAGIEEVTIDWETQDSAEIMALVNATNPWNLGAFTYIRGITLRILEVSVMPKIGGEISPGVLPGTIIALNEESGLLVTCRDGKILKLEILHTDMGFITGKRLMALGVQVGERFGN